MGAVLPGNDWRVGSDLARTFRGKEAELARNTTPAGVMVAYAGTEAPDGWLLCDGSLVNRIKFGELFGAISTRYGQGDGNTNFGLPDLRSAMPAGLDSRDVAYDKLGDTGGAKTHTLTTAESPAHTHTIASGQSVTGARLVASLLLAVGPDVVTNSSGGGGAHENMPPYVVFNFIIKT